MRDPNTPTPSGPRRPTALSGAPDAPTGALEAPPAAERNPPRQRHDEASGERPVEVRYDDPLELIWTGLLRDLGWRLQRSDEVYAHWDGQGGLSLSSPRGFDADDCLAQLILHELCHALVEGPQGQALPDWGLSNRDERHLPREFACHRLQAALAGAHGLRRLFAPTTAHREHYDGLPADPLACPDDADAATRAEVAAARLGWERATTGAWAAALDRALVDSAALARLVAAHAPAGSLWRRIAGGPDDDGRGAAGA